MRRADVVVGHVALAAFAALLALAPAVVVRAEPVDDAVRALLSTLSRTPPATTRYFERRESPLLSEPLLFGGMLEQPRIDVLIKTVEGDRAERMEIEKQRVRVIRDGRRVRSFSLQRAPELSALAASMAALLAGDPDALEALYRVQHVADGDAWRIELVPRDARLARRVTRMQLLGSGRDWRCLDLQLEGGENSRMWLGEVAALAAASADEAARDALCQSAAADDET